MPNIQNQWLHYIFLNDLEALHDLKETPKDPIVLLQSKRIYFVRYGFVDYSVGGFVLSLDDRKFGLEIHAGTWNEQGSKKSSSFREFGNFVVQMELKAK